MASGRRERSIWLGQLSQAISFAVVDIFLTMVGMRCALIGLRLAGIFFSMKVSRQREPYDCCGALLLATFLALAVVSSTKTDRRGLPWQSTWLRLVNIFISTANSVL